MNRIHNKQEECVKKWSGNICPKIKKKVEKNAEIANTCYVLPAGKGVFQVTEKEHQYIVDIIAKHCECRRWQLTGIPCNHAISCLRSERIKPKDVVSFCYSTEKFMEAYGFNIMPVRDKTAWAKMNGVKVNPPVYEKKVGRPSRCRRKQPQELEGGTKIFKHGVQLHCSYCQGVNHNKKGCKKRKEDIKSGKQQASAPSLQPVQEDVMPLQVMPDILNSQTRGPAGIPCTRRVQRRGGDPLYSSCLAEAAPLAVDEEGNRDLMLSETRSAPSECGRKEPAQDAALVMAPPVLPNL
ncbi:uncharacterized protein [Oryza sativa Japonica Group]|uniref:uncharacterized protein n=1 Tax=Oryza sativa subsp. japonica TaxID=39947 RepID=UPI00339C04F2